MKRFEHREPTSATPEQVWAVLTDLDGWTRWNVASASAPRGLEVGAPLRLGMRLGSGRRLRARARLIEVAPGRALVWRGGVPGLFRAEHGFRIDPAPDGTEILHFEVFRGLLVHPILALLGPEHPKRYGEVAARLAATAETP